MRTQRTDIRLLLTLCMWFALGCPLLAETIQETVMDSELEWFVPEMADTAKQTSIFVEEDIPLSLEDSTVAIGKDEKARSVSLQATDESTGKRDWTQWKPNPQRAMWLAIVIPGAGQIYNRKFWKLPIIYGGFLGCAYAMRWNNQQYHDYSKAYMDLMDDDPTTESYNQFMHLGVRITESNMSHYRDLFKKRKDYYRRYRDMSFFIMVGVYALSVIDAYVDASLAQFDISDDLSLRIAPSVIDNHTSQNPFRSSALGLQCSLNF